MDQRDVTMLVCGVLVLGDGGVVHGLRLGRKLISEAGLITPDW